jgi:hypothetical protein
MIKEESDESMSDVEMQVGINNKGEVAMVPPPSKR